MCFGTQQAVRLFIIGGRRFLRSGWHMLQLVADVDASAQVSESQHTQEQWTAMVVVLKATTGFALSTRSSVPPREGAVLNAIYRGMCTCQ